MNDPGTSDSSTDEYVRHRGLLFTVAYEMLGSVADAEDVVAEVWQRWAGVAAEEIEDPRAYLIRIVSRLALNRLRTVARQREDYIGPWLPEPLTALSGAVPAAYPADPADQAALSDSVSTAMLMVLETLEPVERAVFVLHEVFAVPHAEIAETVGKTPTAVRQIASRARRRVTERRPTGATSPAEHRRVVEQFRSAAVTGNLDGLLELLSPDVVLHTDGGGIVSAARRPINGRDHVLRFLAGVGGGGRPRVDEVEVGSWPGLAIYAEGDDGEIALDTIATVDVVDGLVAAIYLVRNPEKLAHLQ